MFTPSADSRKPGRIAERSLCHALFVAAAQFVLLFPSLRVLRSPDGVARSFSCSVILVLSVRLDRVWKFRSFRQYVLQRGRCDYEEAAE